MNSERNVYLKTIPTREAVDIAVKAFDLRKLLAIESIPSQSVVDRISAEPLLARYSSPSFHSAAMDGIAVRAESTFGAREGAPVRLTKDVDFIPINTGNPLPSTPFAPDAVIMIEDVDQIDESTVAVEKAVFPWKHVRRIGEDIVAEELLFPRNHIFTPYDVGALLSAGIFEVPVWERPSILFIPTGDEVLDSTHRPEPGPGQVVESNSHVLSALAERIGCTTRRLPPVQDDPDALSDALQRGLDSGAHVIVFCAGSSAGSKDFTRKTFERFGRILVHGIQAMPGKPTILAEAQGRLLVGAPGYPVSSVVAFEQVVAPVIAKSSMRPLPERSIIHVESARKSPSKPGMDEYLRMIVGKVGDRYVGMPLGRGAGNITTLSRAHGFTVIPTESEGLEQSSVAQVELITSRASLERTLLVVGSHDNIIDLIADRLMALDNPVHVSSAHVGSTAGLSAIRDVLCHTAGSHLFDPESGDYNFPFLERYLGRLASQVTLINLAVRSQGLMTAPGNPKNIQSITDLSADSIRYINRQRGAGTRILFDYHLRQAGIAPDDINGYGKEEYTHTAVAANILTGEADAGLGIMAAAKALGLDFVPLAKERYDLVIPNHLLDDPLIIDLLDLLRQDDFKAAAASLGGYETYLTGSIMQPGQGLNPL